MSSCVTFSVHSVVAGCTFLPIQINALCLVTIRYRSGCCMWVALCFKGIVETHINKLGKKSESPVGLEPMTFRTPGGCSTIGLASFRVLVAQLVKNYI